MIEWIKNIAMFLVISGLLLEMIAETKYYKFARWVTGVILILQLIQPFVDTQNLWERFLASFRSFDYAIGSERVLEEIYATTDVSAQSVLKSYRESIIGQVETILNQYSIGLVDTEIEIKEDGTLEWLYVLGEYKTKEEAFVRIPTVVPVEITKEQWEEEQNVISPMELYLQEILAEFYHVDKNRINVVIQEATG